MAVNKPRLFLIMAGVMRKFFLHHIIFYQVKVSDVCILEKKMLPIDVSESNCVVVAKYGKMGRCVRACFAWKSVCEERR